ncbi:MAG: alanine--glyoxylate aminotransferase family protein [Pirellulales bacterium]
MPKKRLLTPGPTQVPEAARLSLAREVGHHRTPEFNALFAEVLDGLKYAFQTKNDVIVLASSGTGAMEAAVVNVIPRGGKAIVLNGGVFAERWAHIARAFGIEVIEHKVEWGQAVEAADVSRLLEKHPDAVAVFGTLMESSTGVVHDVKSIATVVRSTPAVFVVDAISGAGAVECRTDEWGIDVLVVGSQKALMLPPGLAFLAISEKAWRLIDRVQRQAFYFDLKLHRAKLREGPTTPWTPAHTLIGALAETLRQIRSEGLDVVLARTRTLAEAARAGIAALGMELFAARPADGMTAVRVPRDIDGAEFLQRLEARFGLKLTGGQMQLKGKIFRIAHFGLIDELDIIGALAAIEMTLHELGHPVKLGSAVAAASEVFVRQKDRR